MTDLERLLKLAEVKSPTECWNWIGAESANGRTGSFHLYGKTWTAHRASYRLHNGLFDDWLNVLHKCDNPKCINPSHLFLGTQQENIDDMCNKRRGVSPKGEACGRSFLTNEIVLDIRKRFLEGITKRDIAKHYHITRQGVHSIVTRKTWKHI